VCVSTGVARQGTPTPRGELCSCACGGGAGRAMPEGRRGAHASGFAAGAIHLYSALGPTGGSARGLSWATTACPWADP
jgi:hypothetical protein